MSHRVALIGCPDYSLPGVEMALRRGFDLLGGVSRFVGKGEALLLKPNLLTAADPERAVTTHPALFEALCRIASDHGARILYGDSPGLGNSEGVVRATGYAAIGQRFNARMADFTRRVEVTSPEATLLKRMTLSPAVFDCDGIISLSKLKSHGLTRMTGAVKNLFGCVPGLLKGEYHVRMPHIDHFSNALLDILQRVSPRLHIMDAIVAMEGNGPRSGNPIHIGTLIMADNAVTLDRAACRLIHLPPDSVPTLTAASMRGLGPALDRDDSIEWLGDPLDSLSKPDFVIPRHPIDGLASKRHFPQFIKRFITPKPVVDPQRCTRCGVCERVCPVTPKAMKSPESGAVPAADMEICIRCYCCQELCPHGAIHLATPWLGRLLHPSQT